MTRYLLDTNAVSHLVRHPRGPVAQRARAVGDGNVCTSIIVAAELRFGAARRPAPRLVTQLEAVLGTLDIVPFDSPADTIYGWLRCNLEAAGQTIGANDLLIAAHTVALDAVLITDDREFGRIQGLVVENWQRGG